MPVQISYQSSTGTLGMYRYLGITRRRENDNLATYCYSKIHHGHEKAPMSRREKEERMDSKESIRNLTLDAKFVAEVEIHSKQQGFLSFQMSQTMATKDDFHARPQKGKEIIKEHPNCHDQPSTSVQRKCAKLQLRRR